MLQRLNTRGAKLSDQEVRNCLMIMANKLFYEFTLILEQTEPYRKCIPITDRKADEQFRMESVLRLMIAKSLIGKIFPGTLNSSN